MHVLDLPAQLILGISRAESTLLELNKQPNTSLLSSSRVPVLRNRQRCKPVIELHRVTV